MPKLLGTQLDLKRCPHCNVDSPTVQYFQQTETNDFANRNPRKWRFYTCKRCGGVITAAGREWNQEITEMYPAGDTDIDTAIPDRARTYLDQAINSLSSPAGAVMLAACGVDAMLKAKNYKEGSLYSRIDKATNDNLITSEMAAWAHDVRLDANDQRHADETTPLPDTADAKRVVDFAIALAQFMFVLPARVQRGRAEAQRK